MSSSRQGQIPSELGWLVDLLENVQGRLRTLEAPSGEALSSSVAKLEALIETAVVPVDIRVMDGTAAIGGSAASFAAASVPTPAGYTRALVSATAQAALRNTGEESSWGILQVACLVAGVGTLSARQTITGTQQGSASASNSALLSDLSEGDPVTASAWVSFGGTSDLGVASTMGQVLFLR